MSAGSWPADIAHILITHVHLDHAGATGALLPHAPNARVYVHQIGAPHLINPEKLLASATRIYGDQMERLWGTILPVPAERVTAIDEGTVVTVGGRTLYALYTPGHAIHHVAYHDATRRALFTGDVAGVRLEGSSYVRPPTPPPDLNLEDWSASIARLRALKPETLYLPHFGDVTGDLGTHFDNLSSRLYAWGDLVRQGIRTGMSDTEIAAELARVSNPDVVRAGPTQFAPDGPHEIHRYELATNYLMSAQGYMRYYRKTRPDLLES